MLFRSIPVTPVGMWGAHRIMFKGRKPDWRTGVAVSVVVGEPIAVAPDEDLRVATDRIMGGVCAAVARAREIYPQTPTADEDDWWVRAPGTAVDWVWPSVTKARYAMDSTRSPLAAACA
mgnify:CR=1 FL=1